MNEDMKLYPFDLSINEVEIEVSAAEGAVVAARMRKPTDGEEFDRESRSSVQYAELNGGKEESITVLGAEADGNLFDRTVQEVKGFVLFGENESLGEDWREATPELIAEIPLSYKSTFIGGTRMFHTRLVRDERKVVVLGGPRVGQVELKVGNEKSPDYVVSFFIPLPSESERERFQREAAEFSVSKENKGTSYLRFNLKPCVEEFNKLMLSSPSANITGGGFEGKLWSDVSSNPIARQQFLNSISPVIKQRVLNTLFSQYGARLRD